MRDIEAIVFDLGGVIVDVDFARVTKRWAELARCDAAALHARFSLDEAYAQHERGGITAVEYFASLRRSLDIDISDEQFLEGWNAIFAGVIPGIEPLIERAAGQYPLYVFSNSNPTHEALWAPKYARTLEPFRRVFVSSNIGLRKPDVAAYRFVAREIDVAPDRILFFDDSPANVAGAEEAGLKAVLVRSNDDVAATMSALLAEQP